MHARNAQEEWGDQSAVFLEVKLSVLINIIV